MNALAVVIGILAVFAGMSYWANRDVCPHDELRPLQHPSGPLYCCLACDSIGTLDEMRPE